MTDVYGTALTTIRAGAPGLSDATCEVIARTIARKLKAPQPTPARKTVVLSTETFIADEEGGPVSGICIDLPDGSQIWSGECSHALLEEAAALDESPDESGQFLMMATKGKATRVVAQVATVDDGIALARGLALNATSSASPAPSPAILVNEGQS